MPRKRRDIPWLDWRDGVAYVYWYSERSKRTERLSLRTGDPDQAKRRYAAFLIEGTSVYEGAAQAGNGYTCALMLDDYLREHVKEKVVDQRRAEDAIAHLKAHFGPTLAGAVDIPSCRAYAALRRSGGIGKRPVTDGTVRRELTVLVAAAGHAVRWKRLTKMDTPTVELPPDSAPDERWLTRDELARLRAAASPMVRDFIDLCYYTASRRKAIERLTWFQVDLEHGRINLAAPGERRTKKRRPVVAIDPALRPVLERRQAERTNEWVLGSPEKMYRRFETARKKAGLGRDVSPHTLRHSRATHLLQGGATIWDVAKLLGDTVATVDRTYGHHCADHMAEVMGREVEK